LPARQLPGQGRAGGAAGAAQTAAYCGAPAALESFRVAERVLAEIDAGE